MMLTVSEGIREELHDMRHQWRRQVYLPLAVTDVH